MAKGLAWSFFLLLLSAAHTLIPYDGVLVKWVRGPKASLGLRGIITLFRDASVDGRALLSMVGISVGLSF